MNLSEAKRICEMEQSALLPQGPWATKRYPLDHPLRDIAKKEFNLVAYESIDVWIDRLVYKAKGFIEGKEAGN